MDEQKKTAMLEYLKSVAELDSCILPYKEQKTELKKDYVEKGVLTKEEIAALTKAYNAVKKDQNFDLFEELLNMVREEREKGKLP